MQLFSSWKQLNSRLLQFRRRHGCLCNLSYHIFTMKTDAGNIKIRKLVRSSSLFKELKHSYVDYDMTATYGTQTFTKRLSFLFLSKKISDIVSGR